MKLVWSLDMPATSAVTMAAAAEAIVTKEVWRRANCSPHSTCRNPAPVPPTTRPNAIDGAFPAHKPAAMTMPLTTSVAGVKRIKTDLTAPIRSVRAARDAASALAAPDAR
uniref:hypothetical protein n=1 Tax=Gordonibacter sp. An230 TaxID=1965592 RepID=UPI001EF55607|nr:hypothetical protein [Gordonibacter sp. An230]